MDVNDAKLEKQNGVDALLSAIRFSFFIYLPLGYYTCPPTRSFQIIDTKIMNMWKVGTFLRWEGENEWLRKSWFSSGCFKKP